MRLIITAPNTFLTTVVENPNLLSDSDKVPLKKGQIIEIESYELHWAKYWKVKLPHVDNDLFIYKYLAKIEE